MLKNVVSAARLISGEEPNKQARRSQVNATYVLEPHPHRQNSDRIQVEAVCLLPTSYTVRDADHAQVVLRPAGSFRVILNLRFTCPRHESGAILHR
jgi:hypothetical protein